MLSNINNTVFKLIISLNVLQYISLNYNTYIDTRWKLYKPRGGAKRNWGGEDSKVYSFINFTVSPNIKKMGGGQPEKIFELVWPKNHVYTVIQGEIFLKSNLKFFTILLLFNIFIFFKVIF